jgi:hypothetical protein
MSAYDMTFSDAIYGSCKRYVSRERLETMLEHESRLLQERLGRTAGRDRRFFVFADTVAARSFRRHDESHGWMGLRFQHAPARRSATSFSTCACSIPRISSSRRRSAWSG